MDLLWLVLIIYIDNLIVHTKTFQGHMEALRLVMDRCIELNLKLNLSKCFFLKEEIKALGFVFSGEGVKPDPSKCEMIRAMPMPETKQEAQRFLGMLNWYREFMPYLAHWAAPLYEATGGDGKFTVTPELIQSYEKCRDLIHKDVMNTHFRDNKETHMYFDASKRAICVILVQDGKIVACYSRALNTAERKYCPMELELLAIKYGCKKLRKYLYGRTVFVHTDHKPLLGLFNKNGKKEIMNNRVQGMLLDLAEFDIVILYIEGKKNVLADLGSRNVPRDDDESMVLLVLAAGDHEQLNRMESKKHGNDILVKVRGIWKQYVPEKERRALMWIVHTPKHGGYSEMYSELGDFHWRGKEDDIRSFLTQCTCTKEKNDPASRFKLFKFGSLKAQNPMDILCVDVYEYADKQYLTMMDLASDFKECYPMKNKSGPEPKT